MFIEIRPPQSRGRGARREEGGREEGVINTNYEWKAIDRRRPSVLE
jgi:hypothetical protein